MPNRKGVGINEGGWGGGGGGGWKVVGKFFRT